MQIRLTAATAAVLAISTPALAQDADSDSPPNGLRPGAWSISFSAPGNFDAGSAGSWGRGGWWAPAPTWASPWA